MDPFVIYRTDRSHAGRVACPLLNPDPPTIIIRLPSDVRRIQHLTRRRAKAPRRVFLYEGVVGSERHRDNHEAGDESDQLAGNTAARSGQFGEELTRGERAFATVERQATTERIEFALGQLTRAGQLHAGVTRRQRAPAFERMLASQHLPGDAG